MRLPLVVALAAVVACARGAPDVDAEPKSEAMITVENRGFSDMTIYVIRGSQRSRLGIVTGNTTKSFPLPRQFVNVGPVRFLADPIGSDRAPVSDEVTVYEGDMVTLSIP